MDLGPCFVYVCFHIHAYNEKQTQLGVVHGPGPQRWPMDRVHGVVHGPGPQGWSMDPGPCGPWGGPCTGSTRVVHGPWSMFCIRPFWTASCKWLTFLGLFL